MNLLKDCISYANDKSNRMFRFVATTTALYAALVISFSYIYEIVNSNHLVFSLLAAIVMFIPLYFFIIYAGRNFASSTGIKVYKEKAQFCWKKYTLTFFLIFIPMLIGYLYWYPGIHNLDTLGQWMQVTSNTFNDWHPAFHTLTIWFISRVCESYSFVVLVQNILFCFALSYLFSTLDRWGLSIKALAVIFGIIVLTPETQTIMQILLKDCMFTVAVIILTAMLIDMYFDDCSLKLAQIVTFSVISGAATMLRHNAFFYTVPLVLFLTTKYWKRQYVKYMIVIFVLTVVVIRWPVYSFFRVTYPNNIVSESVGWPMTILGDIYVKNPSGLDDEAKNFLLTFSDDKAWKEKYRLGDFDSIKWETESDQEFLSNNSVNKYLSMTLRAVINNPLIAFGAVRQLTSVVWNMNDEFNLFMYLDREFYIEIEEYKSLLSTQNTPVPDFIERYIRAPLFLPLVFFPQSIILNTGTRLLLLLLCYAITFTKNRVRSHFLVLPILLYCLLTSPLLASPGEQRIFHFILVVTFPICMVLFTENKINNCNGDNVTDDCSMPNGGSA